MSGLMVDMDRVMTLMKTAAAEIVLPRFQSLQDSDVSEKAGGELVTIADIETEKWLTERLPDLLSGSIVVGEEAVFADKTVFARLAGDDPVWVIDPIDGTWNFANGRPTFAVMVSLVSGGEIICGWIYEPVTGTTVMGSRGDGVLFDGVPVRLGKTERQGFISGTAARHLFVRAEQRADVIAEVYRPNCAGHEYVLILSGERSFSAYTKLLPWDHAAGSFLVSEAGGHSALLDGGKYDFAHPDGNLLTAETSETWHTVRSIIDPKDA